MDGGDVAVRGARKRTVDGDRRGPSGGGGGHQQDDPPSGEKEALGAIGPGGRTERPLELVPTPASREGSLMKTCGSPLIAITPSGPSRSPESAHPDRSVATLG